VCSALDPAFNLWDSVEPYAQRLIREERGNVVQDLGRQAVDNLALLWRLPRRLDALASTLEDGTLAVTVPSVERRLNRLDATVRRVVSAVLFAGLLIGGAVVRPDDAVLGSVLMIVSVVPLLHALFSGRRAA